MPRLVSLLCLFALLAGLSGCGGRPVGISGTITHGGKKLTWPGGGYLLVVFSPENATQTSKVYAATTDIATSSYRVETIPTGRYRVAIQQFSEKHMDALGGGYDPGHTTLLYEVVQDGQVIDIDLPAEVPEGGAKGKQEKGDDAKKE